MSAQPAPPTPSTTRPEPSRRTSAISKRTSVLPKPSSIVLDPSVLIAQHAQLTGTHPITVGPNTVLHPHSKISSAMAPVVLGEGVVVYERGRVGVGMGRGADGEESRRSSVMSRNSMQDRGEGTVLGKNVIVETGAVVEASEVGEGTVIEVGASIGRGCVIGRYCTISASTALGPNTQIPDFQVVYGAGGSQRRIDKTLRDRKEVLEAKIHMHTKQLEMFKRLVPNNVAKWT